MTHNYAAVLFQLVVSMFILLLYRIYTDKRNTEWCTKHPYLHADQQEKQSTEEHSFCAPLCVCALCGCDVQKIQYYDYMIIIFQVLMFTLLSIL